MPNIEEMPYIAVSLAKDFKMFHLIIEVAPIKLHVEDSLIEQLQFLDSEFFWQQFKTYWLEVSR